MPKSCGAGNCKNKRELNMRMFNYHTGLMHQTEDGQVKSNKLCCLPVEDSPLRSIWHDSRSLTTLVAFSSWILVLVLATLEFHKLRSSKSRSNCP